VIHLVAQAQSWNSPDTYSRIVLSRVSDVEW
jgi:hypothetical protein